MKLRNTIRFSTGTKLKLTIEAIGQILYEATMMGIVSCGTVSACTTRSRTLLVMLQQTGVR